ncbi:MAG TPA: permease [Anaerolineales bacterium]|nr:permease [Anaerolineales bacterium]
MSERIRSALRTAGPAAFAVPAVLAILVAVRWLFFEMGNAPPAFVDSVSTFTTIFLGIFIEAAPFLLLGTLASGLVEVFVGQGGISRLAPRNPIAGALFGSGLGLVFPVCECGVVPLTRRLLRKGIPAHVGISFLLASPVINPIAIASTMAAFGFGKILFFRVGLSLLIAMLTGLVFAFQKNPATLLRMVRNPAPAPHGVGAAYIAAPQPQPLQVRVRRALAIAGDEFFEMGRYLVIGALLASLMQTFVPRTFLLSFNQGPLIPVLAMIALAVVLSICSTVDSFVALAFVSSFSNGSILAFLVFGAMVDIKSTLLFLRVFERRTVVYIILLPLLMTILAAVLINIYAPL